MTSETGKKIGTSIGGFLLVLAGGFCGLFLIAKLWPLPRHQGLTYVAHPTIALGGTVLAAVGFVIIHLVKQGRFFQWLLIAIALSWAFSLMIWTLR